MNDPIVSKAIVVTIIVFGLLIIFIVVFQLLIELFGRVAWRRFGKWLIRLFYTPWEVRECGCRVRFPYASPMQYEPCSACAERLRQERWQREQTQGVVYCPHCGNTLRVQIEATNPAPDPPVV